MIHRREKLVSLRKSNNLTQKDVVEFLKENYDVSITESYYGMIEQGVRTPKLDIAVAISKLFDADVEDVFFDPKPNKMLFEEQKPSA